MEVDHIYPISNNEKTPKIIQDKFLELSFEKTTRNGEKIKWPPYFSVHNCKEGRYYFLESNLSHLKDIVQLGYCFDSDLNQISLNKLNDYLESYGKGFRKGYFSLVTNLKENELFAVDNSILVDNVFSILFDSDALKHGFQLKNFQSYQDEEKVEKLYGVRHHYFLDHELMYESGVSGGEYYKAWEIVLKNPTLFKDLFNEFFKDEKSGREINDNKRNIISIYSMIDEQDLKTITGLISDEFLKFDGGMVIFDAPNKSYQEKNQKYLAHFIVDLKRKGYIKTGYSKKQEAEVFSGYFNVELSAKTYGKWLNNPDEDFLENYRIIPNRC